MPASRTEALLQIFTEVGARNGLRPVHEDITLKARKARLAGVTVLRGVMGYGRAGQVRRARPLGLAPKLPLVVEIVDTEEKLKAFLPVLDRMRNVGLVTWRTLEAAHHGGRKPRARG